MKQGMSEVVLDPFTVVCKLALLAYKAEGTKLEVCDNRIAFAHPVVKEQLYRWFMSHFFDHAAFSRGALCNLRKPICRALKWYSDIAPTVFENARVGITRLLVLYRADSVHDNAVVTLTYCLTIMQRFYDLPELADVAEDAPRTEMLHTLRSQWREAEIVCVETWMGLLAASESDVDAAAVSETIESYLTRKEPKLRRIMTQTAV
jgi:hypothetical protein